MDEFLHRAARDLNLEIEEAGPNTWTVRVPTTLVRVFGNESFNVTTDKQLAALDPQLQLLSPNSSLTVALAEQLRTRGRPTHRARLQWQPDPAEILQQAQDQQYVQGVTLHAYPTQWRLMLRIVYRVRFEREVIEETMLACCVDYEHGTTYPAITDISPLRELLAPLPQTDLSEAHINAALSRARHWLELALYPDKVRHEADLSQRLAVEQARINAFYDALTEDSSMALGARADDTEATTLEDERKRLLEEQEYRYALSLAAETVSVATLQVPITTLGSAEHPSLLVHCPLFEPPLQLPHCTACGRSAAVVLSNQRFLCAICREVFGA